MMRSVLAVTDPPPFFDEIQQVSEPWVRLQTLLMKQEIGESAARLRTAQTADDNVAINAARAELATRGDSLVNLYRAGSKTSPKLRDGLEYLIDMYLGKASR
jgi:hypothetical protein